MLRKKNQCRTCKTSMISPDSRLLGRCFYCRNYTKIQRLRVIEHESFMNKMEKMPVSTINQRLDKRSVRDELLHGKQNFIKYGRMEKNTKYKDNAKMEMLAIKIAIRDPETEKRIVWAKLNKGMLK